MTTLAAGSATSLTLPAGSTLTLSGLGTHQTAPPGANGGISPKQLVQILAQPSTLGPLASAVTVNLVAAAGGPGVKYSMASSASDNDTKTAELVTVSRNLTQDDNRQIIPIANGVTLTAVGGTLTNFSCVAMPVTGATASLAFSGGASGNGATTTITRTRTANAAGFAIIQDYATGQDAFAVGGA